MTAPVGNNRPAAPTAPAASSGPALSPTQAKTFVDGLIAKDFELRKTTLGETRANAMKTEVTKKMTDFLAANPKASEADIKAEFEKTNSKEAGYQITNKMRDDAFVSRMKRKMKEALADRWE